MNIISKFVDSIYLLESNQFRKYALIFIGIFIGLIIGIQFLFILKINSLDAKKKKILDTQNHINNLTRKKYMIEVVKQKIDSVLKKDSYFFIKDYFLSFVATSNLHNFMIDNDSVPIEQPLKPGYIEISYNFAFHNLNIKQIVDFLSSIEANERVYIKEVGIKQDEHKTMECSGTIATIRLTGQ